MAACYWPPMVVPIHYDPSFKVSVRLKEPLLAGTDSPSDIEIHMMSLCAQLDFLCKKELMKQPSQRIDNGRTSSAFVNRAGVVYDQMEQLLRKINSPHNVQTYIESMWLDRMYPRVAAYVARPNNMSLTLKSTSLDNHFSQLASLHHLETLARQMNNDVSSYPRPKYIAHQLAILYQALSNIEGSSEVLAIQKKNIEDNFKTVKAAFAASQENTHLEPEIREWLLTLTNNLVSVVTSLPPQLTKDIVQPATILSRT